MWQAVPSGMPDDQISQLRDFLIDSFGALPRRSWGLDALYHRGRMFLVFDGEEMVGKWPAVTRERLRTTLPGVRAFIEEGDAAEASWLRVPLATLADLDAAIELALEAAAYVHTAEGAPTTRRRSQRGGRSSVSSGP